MKILDRAFRIVTIIWILVFLTFLYARDKNIKLIDDKIVVFVAVLLLVVCFTYPKRINSFFGFKTKASRRSLGLW